MGNRAPKVVGGCGVGGMGMGRWRGGGWGTAVIYIEE